MVLGVGHFEGSNLDEVSKPVHHIAAFVGFADLTGKQEAGDAPDRDQTELQHEWNQIFGSVVQQIGVADVFRRRFS